MLFDKVLVDKGKVLMKWFSSKKGDRNEETISFRVSVINWNEYLC